MYAPARDFRALHPQDAHEGGTPAVHGRTEIVLVEAARDDGPIIGADKETQAVRGPGQVHDPLQAPAEVSHEVRL